MRWKPFTPGTPYTCNDCPALVAMRIDRDYWRDRAASPQTENDDPSRENGETE